MTIKEKIIQYLDLKDVSKSNFYKKIEVSNSFLASGKTIGSDKLIKIRDNYPDLNMNWLIFNEGEMLLSSDKINESDIQYNTKSNLSLEDRIKVIENYLRLDKEFEDYINSIKNNN